MAGQTATRLGRNVEILLGHLELTQEQFGKLCGWPSSRVNSIIKARYNATTTTIDIIAAAMNKHRGIDGLINAEILVAEKLRIPEEILNQPA